MHVVITGAAGGVGRQLVAAYAGHHLTVVDRDAEGLAEVAAAHGAEAFTVDLADLEHCTAFLDAAVERSGPVDLLILNAAMGLVGDALEVPTATAERVFRVNLLAPLRIARRVATSMVERRSGTIVAVTSVTALTSAPFQAHYSASKAGLSTYMEALRSELRGTGVSVIVVYPGPIDTPMHQATVDRLEQVPRLERMPVASPAGLAARIVGAVEAGEGRVVYPSGYGLIRWFYAVSQWVTVRFPIPPRR